MIFAFFENWRNNSIGVERFTNFKHENFIESIRASKCLHENSLSFVSQGFSNAKT